MRCAIWMRPMGMGLRGRLGGITCAATTSSSSGRTRGSAEEPTNAASAINPDFAYSHWALAYLGRPGDTPRAHRPHPPRIDARRRLRRPAPTCSTRCSRNSTPPTTRSGLGKRSRRASPTGAARSTTTPRKRRRCSTQLRHRDDRAWLRRRASPRRQATGRCRSSYSACRAPAPRCSSACSAAIRRSRLCGELNDFRMQYKWATDHHSASASSTRSGIAAAGRRGLRATRPALPGARGLARARRQPFQRQESRQLHAGRPDPARVAAGEDRAPAPQCDGQLFLQPQGIVRRPTRIPTATISATWPRTTGTIPRLMAHWHEIAPGRILDVNYEDMVSDPDAAARR